MTKVQEAIKVHDGAADFDFLIGTWTGHNRRLRERLKGSTSWEEFESTVTARKILGGAGNIDEVTMNREVGLVYGFTLRLYDPNAQQWSLFWANGMNAVITPPEVGSFKNGRGEFHAQELFEGRMIFSRYVWCEITESSCRWEQAFSEDGGSTWETNWTMDFTRR